VREGTHGRGELRRTGSCAVPGPCAWSVFGRESASEVSFRDARFLSGFQGWRLAWSVSMKPGQTLLTRICARGRGGVNSRPTHWIFSRQRPGTHLVRGPLGGEAASQVRDGALGRVVEDLRWVNEGQHHGKRNADEKRLRAPAGWAS
jgi:hypothetical protein